MRFRLCILALIAGGVALAQSPLQEQAAPARVDLIDRIVAVVNKEVITQYELAERMNRVQRELERRGTSLPDRGEIERSEERRVGKECRARWAREDEKTENE